MAKKPKNSKFKQVYSDKEIGNLNSKEVAKQISGQPDEEDYRTIALILEDFERKFPGRLRKMKTDYDVERGLTGRDPNYGTISEDSEMRFSMWMPQDIQMVLEKYFPTIWTNKDHLHWFLRHFPVFRGAPKI